MPHIKNLKKNVIERIFVKPSSLFAKWQEDNDEIVQECINHDLKFCKFAKFIKNKEELNEIMLILKKNFREIKEVFTCIVAGSEYYPRIG